MDIEKYLVLNVIKERVVGYLFGLNIYFVFLEF